MIEDRELWALFSAESEEHLQSLEEGLLRLESLPGDTTTLDQVFRSAHSLKGAARMLEATRVEELSHAFEDALGGAARGEDKLSAVTIERLYGALDALRALVREAVEDQPAGVDLERVIQGLYSASSGSLSTTKPLPAESTSPLEPGETVLVAFHSGDRNDDRSDDQTALAPSEPASPRRETALAPVSAPEWKIETMRVEPAKLDALLAMAGELVVSTTRAGRSRSELDALTALWEEGHRTSSAQRRLLREMEGALPATGQGTLREMERLVEREAQRWEALGTLLARLRGTADDVNRLANVVSEMEEAIRGVRLLPLSTLFALFPRTVRDLAKAQGKEVHFTLEGGDTVADKRIIEELKDPLMHMVRNAVDHGLEVPRDRVANGKDATASLCLRGFQTATQVVVELEDDGRGLDLDAIKRSALKKRLITEDELQTLSPHAIQELIFAPGFSTASLITEVSGRGVGLDVVRSNVERLRGTITVESVRGEGTLFRLTLPVTLATTRVLLVRLGSQTFAMPVEAVVSVHHVSSDAVFSLQGRPAFAPNGEPIFLAQGRELLEIRDPATTIPAKTETSTEARGTACIIIAAGNDRIAVCVDEVVDEQEIILKPLGTFLKRVRNVNGATILDTGEVCLVLNPPDLIKSAIKRSAPVVARALPVAATPDAPKTILLVEDSITTRTQEKRILEGAGYAVVVAVDGLDAWGKLSAGEFDAVVSDVEMPRMDGLTLAAKIRSNPKYEEIPIILVTTLASDNDRRRGVEAGANAYITKGSFDQKALLDALRKLV